MTIFEKTLQHFDEFCTERKLEYAVIGGVAVIAYGYQRTTKDIDITVLCALESLNEIYNIFMEGYSALLSNPDIFFKSNFILPIKDNSTKIKIDITAGLTGFDVNIIHRRKRFKMGEAEFYICTLEDLIIYKLFADRLQDKADIKELIFLNKNSIDINYLLDAVEKFKQLDRDDMSVNLKKYLTE